jgi:hypothetical protein
MTALDWVLSSLLFVLYFVCLFTVCLFTFKKGYIVLGIVGIFFPFLWLIGAILPARTGSQFEREESMRRQAALNQVTS